VFDRFEAPIDVSGGFLPSPPLQSPCKLSCPLPLLLLLLLLLHVSFFRKITIKIRRGWMDRRLCVWVRLCVLVFFSFFRVFLSEEEETVERVTYLPHLCLLRVFVFWCRTNVQEERYPFVSTVQDLYRPRDWECWRHTHTHR
jgi:hypothetical protein